MSIKVYVPYTLNFGDLLNAFPVISGFYHSFGEKIKLVVPDQMEQIKGWREFFNFQPMIESSHLRKEIIGMEEDQYIQVIYSPEEYRNLLSRPNRPIETLRHEKFVRDYYPNLGKWEVDDDFYLEVDGQLESYDKFVCGDRWLNKNTDTRRASNVLMDSGLFNDENKFLFLDYSQTAMHNAALIKFSTKPFIGTFTGSSVMADLMNKEHYVLWNKQDMLFWNNAPILYSYWKHYYSDRESQLVEIGEFSL